MKKAIFLLVLVLSLFTFVVLPKTVKASGDVPYGETSKNISQEEFSPSSISGKTTASVTHSKLHTESGYSIKVEVTKTGAGFGGVKLNLSSVANKHIKYVSFDLYNEAVLQSAENVVAIFNFDGANSETVNNVVEVKDADSYKVVVPTSSLTASITKITSVEIGFSGSQNVTFYISNYQVGFKIDEIKAPVDSFITTDSWLNKGADWDEAFVTTAEIVTDNEKSKASDGKAIKLYNDSANDGNFYAYIFPLNSEILKTGTDNVIGLSFWVYNNMENNDGGLYFKDSNGKELYFPELYDANGNEIITSNYRGLNFTGFRKYVLYMPYDMLFRWDIELGVWGGKKDQVIYFSDFAFLAEETAINSKHVDLNNMNVTHFSWSPDGSLEADNDNRVISSDTYAHADGKCIEVRRIATSAWAISQFYIQDFKTGFVDSAQFTEPVAFSFWLYNEYAVPGDAGLRFMYNNGAETEMWDYYWIDTNGNQGRESNLNFTGYRKYTVLLESHDIACTPWFIGVWGTCAAHIYVSDFAIVERSANATKSYTNLNLTVSHTAVEDAAVAPTCTETGLTAGSHCSQCNEVIVAQDTVPTIEHNWEWVVDKAATYTETGLKHEECSACHEKRSENTVINIVECVHSLSLTAAVDPTCTTAGSKAYYTCSNCGKHFSDADAQLEIADLDAYLPVAALGHDLADDAAVAATCTEAGKTAGHHCTRCDYTDGGETVPATGHDWGEWVVTTPATTTSEGVETRTCNNDPTHTETRSIDRLPDTPTTQAPVTQAPSKTDTPSGNNDAKKGCKSLISSSIIIPVLLVTIVGTIAYKKKKDE